MSKSALGKNLSAETSGTVSRRSLVSYSPVAAVVKKRPLAFYKLTKPGSPSRAVGDGSLFVRDAACVCMVCLHILSSSVLSQLCCQT